MVATSVFLCFLQFFVGHIIEKNKVIVLYIRHAGIVTKEHSYGHMDGPKLS